MDADVKSVDTVQFVKVIDEINATEDIVAVTQLMSEAIKLLAQIRSQINM